jgi:hypothetical protein
MKPWIVAFQCRDVELAGRLMKLFSIATKFFPHESALTIAGTGGRQVMLELAMGIPDRSEA